MSRDLFRGEERRDIEFFEYRVASYTGAPFAVSVDSATTALFLICRYFNVGEVFIPSKTYHSVPHAVLRAGGRVVLDVSEAVNNWQGMYQLNPYPIYDAAQRFQRGMYVPKSFMAVSFGQYKPLSMGGGGMILTHDEESVDWFREAVYDGSFLYNLNMHMTPIQAARGLEILGNYLDFNHSFSNRNPYKDLLDFNIFSDFKFIGK